MAWKRALRRNKRSRNNSTPKRRALSHENLETRQLLASSADVITFQIPGTDIEFDFDSLDFKQGSSLIRDLVPLYAAAAAATTEEEFRAIPPVDILYQAQLNSFESDESKVPDGGLRQSYEITAVLQVSVVLVAPPTRFLTVPGGIVPKTGEFTLAQNQSADAFGLRLYYDDTPNADELSGTGFSDGQLILESRPTSLTAVFTVSEGAPDPDTGVAPALLDTFDRSRNGDQFGIETVAGIGGTLYNGEVTSTNLDAEVFKTPMETFKFDTFTPNTSHKLPFQEVDPSMRFFGLGTPSEPINGYVPKLGALNGVTGPDGQFQADGNASFTLRRGSIHGYKFHDLNFNGIDDNEPRLEGWQFYFDDNDNGMLDWTDAAIGDAEPNGVWDAGEGEQWTATNANGEFWFNDLLVRTLNGESIEYRLREANQPGWVASTTQPANMTLDFGIEYVAEAGQSMIVDDAERALREMILDLNNDSIPDLAFGNAQSGSIHGAKFKDVDADGIYDSNSDQRLANVTINLLGTTGAGIEVSSSTVTNDLGEYWFTDLLPGTYTIAEDIPPGYLASTPTTIADIQVVSGQSLVAVAGQSADANTGSESVLDVDGNGVPDLLIGNYEPGSIHGMEFKDFNANGIYESNIDQRLAGVEFQLTGIDGLGRPIDLSATTDDQGEFWFSDLHPGTYELVETLPDGFIASTPIRRSEIVVTSGLEWIGLEGQAMLPDDLPEISMKREEILDKDDDGTGDPNAPGDGIPDLLFGVYEPGSIHGLKFRDQDANGSFQDSDAPLAGVTFTLAGVDGMGGSVSASAVTNDAGEFLVRGLKPGSYTVTESIPDHFSASTPVSIDLVVTSGLEYVASSGQAMLPDPLPTLSMRRESLNSSLSFGNYETGSIHGLKFKDVNADGVYDLGTDQILPGVTFALTGTDGAGDTVDLTAESDANGEFWFEDLVPGSYTLTEQVPEGYQSSTATQLQDLVVTSGLELVGIEGSANLPDPLLALSAKSESLDTRLLFGNFQLGGIHGTKFLDANANGQFEPDTESYLSGVTFQLTGTDGAGNDVARSATSNSDGEFWFDNLVPGTYAVEEVVPDGFVASTTINVENLTVTSGLHIAGSAGQGMIPDDQTGLSMLTERVDGRLQFGNFETGSIHGLKFLDRDANGEYLAGSDGVIAGVTFTLSGTDTHGETVTAEAQSNDVGEFWFEGLLPGTYSVSETVPNGLQSSTPTTVGNIEITSGTDASLSFGNYQTGSIHGFKFLDNDANGIYDETSDSPLGNVVIQLSGETTTGVPIELSSSTNDAGEYWFENLIPGTYSISEVVPDGFAASTEVSVSGLVIDSGEEVVAQAGQAMLPDPAPDFSHKFETIDSRLNFGNFEGGSIHGLKFKDVNADGIYDAAIDQPLAGVTIQLAGAATQETVTDDQGEFWFEGLRPGTYSVSEVVPDGYLASTATSVSGLQITSGLEIVGVAGQAMLDNLPALSNRTELVNEALRFGNYENGSIHGFKFLDANADGTYDENGDSPLAGVVISLSGDASAAATTDNNGEFWFVDLKPGNYSVAEEVPNGFHASTAISVENLTVQSGQEVVGRSGQAMLPDPAPGLSMKFETVDSRLNFGNYENGSIHGFKFKDANADGVYEAAVDQPLGGVTIRLTGPNANLETVTNDDGEFWFEDLAPGTYSVNEIIPAGYLASTSTAVSGLEITSGVEVVGIAGQAMLDNLPALSSRQEVVNAALQFGNYENGSIHGFKYQDVDSNGQYDETIDRPLGNVTFNLTGTDALGQNIEASTASNDNGEFWFENLRPGTYSVAEVVVEPFVATTSESVSDISVSSGVEWVAFAGQAMLPDPLPEMSMKTEQVLDTNNDGVADLLFGNALKDGSIHGFKYVDVDANGAYDASIDRPYADVQFDLLNGTELLASESTNAEGEFWFTGLLPGSYTVRENSAIFDTGVLASTPTEVTLDVGSGEELAWREGAAMLDGNDPLQALKTEIVVGESLMFGNYVNGSIHAFKFNDSDRDGIYDPNENDSPRPNVTFTLEGDTNGDGNVDTASAQTNADGEFWFENLHPGTYTLKEVFVDPEVQASTPTEITVTIESGQELVWQAGAANLPDDSVRNEVVVGQTLMFGNWSFGSIHGFKFDDFNADGVFDRAAGDRPFGGFTFELSDAAGTVLETAYSDHGGQFWFMGLDPGTYTVREKTEDFWPGIMASTPTEVTVEVGSGEELVFTDGAAHLPAGSSRQEVNVGAELMFGNYVKGSIHGFKFNDFEADGNYVASVDSPYTTAVEFELLQDGAVIGTSNTDANGEFWFENLIPGDYTVREKVESLPSYVHPSTATEIDLFVGSRQELAWQEGAARLEVGSLKKEVIVGTDLQFGNYLHGAIHGLKFEDMNADGNYSLRDGDMPWGGFEFDLIQDGDVIDTQTADHGGVFWFTDLKPGIYTVSERPPSWAEVIPSTPTEVTVVVGSGQELVFADGASEMMGHTIVGTEKNVGSQLMFGNYVKGSIHGFTFGDVDSNGQFDGSDLARSGISVSINGPETSTVLTTGEDGIFELLELQPGEYTVEFTSTTGSTATTPLASKLIVNSGEELVWNDGAAGLDEFGLRDEVNVGNQLAYGETVEAGGEQNSTGGGTVAAIAARHIFYNNSAYDGNDVTLNSADDAAVAPNKSALLPEAKATFANYTSYSRGINGIMIDVASLASDSLDASNFFFRVGSNDDPGTWDLAPAPESISVRAGAGVGDSDRISITWADEAISGQWLQVTVLANDNTGLEADDVHYWGNAVGEIGNSAELALVDATDQSGARDNPHNFFDQADLFDAFDFNRDQLVNGTDVAISRDNFTNFFTGLNLITPVAANEALPALALWNSIDNANEADFGSFHITTIDTDHSELQNVNRHYKDLEYAIAVSRFTQDDSSRSAQQTSKSGRQLDVSSVDELFAKKHRAFTI